MREFIVGCITAVLLGGLLIAGPVSCTIEYERNITARVEAVCSGNLMFVIARSAACDLAIRNQ
jgi:hypothetical protein